MSETTNFVALALTYEEQNKYIEFKTKLSVDVPLSKDENGIYAKMLEKIHAKRSEEQRAPRLTAFQNEAKELMTMGFKISELMNAIRGGTTKKVAVSEPISIISVKYTPAKTNAVPHPRETTAEFTWQDGKAYARKGDEREQLKAFLKMGREAFVKGLTPFGKTWFDEVTVITRGNRKHALGDKVKVNEDKINELFGFKPVPKKDEVKKVA